MYRYEDTTQWKKLLLPIQRQTKQYVTVEQARIAFGLAGKSSARARLMELVERGEAEVFKIGSIPHYHIIENVKK